jgi:hypothetical protein
VQPSPVLADASNSVELSVHVPAALAVARAIDTLTVAVDPASLGSTQVTAHAGMVLGIETDVSVFPQGQARPVLERRGAIPGTDFAMCTAAFDTTRDGVPAPGTKYVVQMQLTLFETDVPAIAEWDPHAGAFKVLWTRALRQAEE